MKLIFFCIKAGKGYGLGHLSRCITLYHQLKDQYDVWFMVKSDRKVQDILKSNNIPYITYWNNLYCINIIKKRRPDLVILDIRDSKAPFTRNIRRYSKVLSLDDLGPGSHYANITIHVLPIPSDSKMTANFGGINYLILKESISQYKKKTIVDQTPTQNESSFKTQRVLVSFGGEDPFKLTEYTVRHLKQFSHSYEVYVILGPIYKGRQDFSGVRVIISPKDFYKELQESDLIITSFGMTVYEALAIGVPVITLNPTEYHNDLADQVNGILNLGLVNESNNQLILEKLQNKLTRNGSSTVKPGTVKIPEIGSKGTKRIADIVNRLLSQEDERCPICNKAGSVYDREKWINQYYCFNCYTFYRSPNYIYNEDYSDDYFTSQYQKQYGRTYLEDKEQINRLNKNRLNVISSIASPNREKGAIRLLEIGSAMGFFLEMAKSVGYKVSGIEISKYASHYAQNELNIQVTNCDFNDFPVSKKEYDIIVAWYFIEHNSSFLSTLRKMKAYLKKGGLIAISTPNSHGISFQSNNEEYIVNIPKDHYIEFSPHSISLLLKKEGFKLEKIVMTGVHFKRFINALPIPSAIQSRIINIRWLEKPILWLMKKLKLGDTFEIYAQKI